MNWFYRVNMNEAVATFFFLSVDILNAKAQIY